MSTAAGRPLPIPFQVYEVIRHLSVQFDMRISLAFVMRYLDVHNVSEVGVPLSYAKRLIEFLDSNEEHLEVAYHGLTHSYRFSPEADRPDAWSSSGGEFFKNDLHQPVPLDSQREAFRKSFDICSNLGWRFPSLFVPPLSAWEMGVTDRLAAEVGVKYLTTHQGRAISQWLTHIPRASLGIGSNETMPSVSHLLAFQRRSLQTRLLRYIMRFHAGYDSRLIHYFLTPVVHNFESHIANFLPTSVSFWKALLRWVRRSGLFRICRDSEEAVELYEEVTTMDPSS